MANTASKFLKDWPYLCQLIVDEPFQSRRRDVNRDEPVWMRPVYQVSPRDRIARGMKSQSVKDKLPRISIHLSMALAVSNLYIIPSVGYEIYEGKELHTMECRSPLLLAVCLTMENIQRLEVPETPNHLVSEILNEITLTLTWWVRDLGRLELLRSEDLIEGSPDGSFRPRLGIEIDPLIKVELPDILRPDAKFPPIVSAVLLNRDLVKQTAAEVGK